MAKNSQEDIDLVRAISISIESAELERALALSIKEVNNKPKETQEFYANSDDIELALALSNSISDTRTETFKESNANLSDDNSDELQIALLISLDDHLVSKQPAKEENGDDGEQDIYEKEFDSNSELPKNGSDDSDTKSSGSSSVRPTRPLFDAAYAYKEQSDIIEACKQSLKETGMYNNNKNGQNELDLIMEYISDKDNSNNGDDCMEVLKYHYDEYIKTSTIKTSYNESNGQVRSASFYDRNEFVPHYEEYTETFTNKIFQEPISLVAATNTEIMEITEPKNLNWLQTIFQRLTNTLSIIVAKGKVILDNILSVIEQYNIIDIRFFRNLLDGKFNLREALSFGFEILKKIVNFVKLFTQIRALNLKSLDFTNIAMMCKNIGLITQA